MSPPLPLDPGATRGAQPAAAPIEERDYEAKARENLAAWQAAMLKDPGAWDRASRGVQDRINKIIPEKVHQIITGAIESMTKSIIIGSDWTTATPLRFATLSQREQEVAKTIDFYRKTAAVEGGVAGAGGFVLAAAEFPVLLTTKMKLLFDIAALYGRDVSDLSERLYILSIFRLAFSSAEHRREVYLSMTDWDGRRAERPSTLAAFDWRKFQQQYRDYIDLAKLAQLLPIVGAGVGVVVNYRLIDKLGKTATNAYRMRLPD
jgi:EcsC protein family